MKLNFNIWLFASLAAELAIFLPERNEMSLNVLCCQRETPCRLDIVGSSDRKGIWLVKKTQY